MLWPEEQQAELLQKSPTLRECRQRRAALQQEWETIAQRIASSDGRRFSEGDRLLCDLPASSPSNALSALNGCAFEALLPHMTITRLLLGRSFGIYD